jgi:hypothetical protein
MSMDFLLLFTRMLKPCDFLKIILKGGKNMMSLEIIHGFGVFTVLFSCGLHQSILGCGSSQLVKSILL